jgi:hypothetical protein
MTTASIGQEGFVWFIGKVEDRDDPLQLGRVKVRIMDFHPESKSLVPTDQLPWAQILLPSTNPSFEKVGLSPVGLTIGTTVFGFFIDGYDANQPVILGTTHGKVGNVSDVPDTSIGLNSVEKTFDSFEPKSAYAAQYPYNKTFRSEQGHVIEIDDTPNQERIHMYHKSGTYKEINKNGNQVDKIVGDHFEITLKNKVVHIKGDVAMLVDGSYTLESKGNMLFKAPRIDINPPGDSGVTSKATDLASEASAQAVTGTQTTIVSSTTTSADVIEGSDATSDSVTGETGSDLGAQIAALFTSGTILGLISQAVEPMVAQEMQALGTFNVGEGNAVSITASGGIEVQDLTVNSTAISVPAEISVGNTTVNTQINATSVSIGGNFSIGGFAFENASTVDFDYTISTNKNAMSAGPITINTGITVTIPSGSVWTIV